MSKELRAPLAEESEKEEEKEMQAIARPDVLEVEEAAGQADTGSGTTSTSHSGQGTLSGVESLPSDPPEPWSPSRFIELPDNILTNYVLVKVGRLLGLEPWYIVRGYETGNPPNVPIRYGENYTDEFLFDRTVTELSIYKTVSTCLPIGGGQVHVRHSDKVVIIYDMKGAITDSGTGISYQAEKLTQMICTEGFKLDTTDIDPAMRYRPYTVYHVGTDNKMINRSILVRGARVGPPPPDMYPESG